MPTYWMHMVSDYSGLTLKDVYLLDLRDFLFLRREAFIYNMSQTDKGLDYLQKAWTYEQTEPDREALRDLRDSLRR